MTAQDRSQALALEILSRCLDLSEDECRTARLRSTSAWDSFAHVELVVEIEERLAIKLTTEQIEGIASYDTLVELLTALA